MPNSDGRRFWRDLGYVLGLCAIWGFAHWQILSALLWGVTFCDTKDHRRKRRWLWDWFSGYENCRLETDVWVFWPSLVPWIVLGPFFLGGTLVFFWIQRHGRN